jgi:hypothetical protein
MESPENDSTCFPPFPQTLEIARRKHRKMKITAGAIPTFPRPRKRLLS